MNVGMHFNTLITMIASGVLVSMMFETYKLLFRPKTLSGKMIVDTLFMLTQSCLVYYLLFITNGGVIRFYIFLAVLLGVSIYFALLQSFFIKFLMWLIGVINEVYRFLKRSVIALIYRPIFWLIQVLLTIIISVILFLWKIILGILKLIKNIIKPFIPKIIQRYMLNFISRCSRIKDKAQYKLKNLWMRWRRENDEGKSE